MPKKNKPTRVKETKKKIGQASNPSISKDFLTDPKQAQSFKPAMREHPEVTARREHFKKHSRKSGTKKAN